MSTVRIRTFNRRKAERFGLKLDWKTRLLYGAIEMRSKVKIYDDKKGYLVHSGIVHGLRNAGSVVLDRKGNFWYYAVHTEKQFSGTYGNLSFSSTLMDGVNGCRLIFNQYSHPERWDTVEREVTPEQEDLMFREACRMADVDYNYIMGRISAGDIKPKEIFQGPKALRYNKTMFIAFVHPWKVWKVSPSKRHCTRAVCNVMHAGGICNVVCDEQMPAQYHLLTMEKEELAKDILGDDFAKAMKERQVKHEQGSEAF